LYSPFHLVVFYVYTHGPRVFFQVEKIIQEFAEQAVQVFQEDVGLVLFDFFQPVMVELGFAPGAGKDFAEGVNVRVLVYDVVEKRGSGAWFGEYGEFDHGAARVWVFGMEKKNSVPGP